VSATTAHALIDAVHRLSTARAFDREEVQRILGAELYPVGGANPEHLVSTAAFDEGPFATAELVEPGPYSRLAERRLVLTPAGSLSIVAIAGWYGPGTPLHLDGRAEDPVATIGYVVEGREIAFTFAVEHGDVRFVTIRRAR
jgi:hypothetical protein